MLRSALAAALRNLLRSKLYAFINVAGLAVAFAAAIYAALFVRDELSYDRWIPRHADVYAIATTYAQYAGVTPFEYLGAYRDVAAWLKLDFPQVESASRLRGQDQMFVRHGDVRSGESSISSVDPDFFVTVPFPSVAGELSTALAQPDSVVLTRAMARKYFGVDTPIGGTLEVDQHLLRVTAIIEDIPPSSSFTGRIFISARAPFSALAAWDRLGTDVERYWKCCGDTFVRLKPGTLKEVQARLRDFTAGRMPDSILGKVQMRLIPLTSLHLADIANPAARQAQTLRWAVIYGVSGLAILIVLGAVLNFVNITTARAATRAVEVGIRKATGATRRQLVGQLMTESLTYTCVAMSVAIGLVLLTMPGVSALLGHSLSFVPWRDPWLAGSIAAATLVAGVLAGIYPAFVLSALQPAAALTGGPLVASGSSLLRWTLVLVQFTILVVFAVITVVIYRQTHYAMNESLNFDKEQIVQVQWACAQAIKTEVAALKGVRQAACGTISYYGYVSTATDGEGHTLGSASGTAFSAIDPELFDVLGVKPLAGRFFSSRFGEDIATADGSSNPSVVLNETAVREFGFATPFDAVGRTIYWKRRSLSRSAVDHQPLLPSRIVGVVSDLFLTVERPAPPVIYYSELGMLLPQGAQATNNLLIKLNGVDVGATLHAIDLIWSKLGTPGLPIRRAFLTQSIEASYQDLVRQGRLVAAFTAVALFIAAVGIFGLAALTARRRTKEVGIRKVMGATRSDVVLLLLWSFAQPALWASVLAWPAAFIIMRRWLEGFAYHIDLTPWMFLGASAVTIGVAVLTVLGHSLLAANVEPATTLRYE